MPVFCDAPSIMPMFNSPSLDALPSELLLTIIERVPFDKSTFGAILHTNTCFQQLLSKYSRSVSQEIARSQYPDISRIYPQPQRVKSTLETDVKWLVMLKDRSGHVKSILNLMACGPLDDLVSLPIRDSWMRLLDAGLHSCYRLHDCPIYAEKVRYIDSLPLLPLALVYITLIFALRTAQTLGTGMMNPVYGPSTEEERMELCLCFEECVLQHGPSFLHEILTTRFPRYPYQREIEDGAHAILQSEYDAFDTRQFGNGDGTLPQRTLISCLKRAIANKSGGAIEKVYRTAWEILQDKRVFGLSTYIFELAFA